MTAAVTPSIIAGAPSFERSRAHARKVEGMLGSDEMIRKTHSELEDMLEGSAREWARLMLEEVLEWRAYVERKIAVEGVDSLPRRYARPSSRHVETVLGRVEVPRLSYQAPGAPDLHPMDAALNLPREMYSHGVRRLVAREAAKSSFEEVVETVEELTGAKIGKRQVEELTIRAATDFDAFYEQRAAARSTQHDLLVISTDAKGIVMRAKDLREGTRRAAEKKTHKLATRLSPGEKSNRKRMSQVATVYSIAPYVRSAADILHTLRDADEVDAKRPRPTEKRVWASVEKSMRAVIREAFEEALRRDPDKKRRWVVLVDGAPKQVSIVKAEARRVGVKITLLADIVHVIEYVWSAARSLFGGSNAKAENWVSDRLLALLSGRSGGDIAKTIRWWESRAKNLDDAARSAIDRACGYLADRTRTRMMGYQQALRDGLPIATGVIEGACRHVVKDRMDRTGARWSLTGAEAVLRLRALRASKDFDAYWTFHLEQERLRNHASRYAGGDIPDPLPVRKPSLKRVK